MTVDHQRELQRLFDEVLPHLLRKPKSKWTKVEILQAIELYFKRPNDGLVNFGAYKMLEAQLRGVSIDQHKTSVPRRGRPSRYTNDKYRTQFKGMQEIRRQIAKEKRVGVEKVRYKEVASRLAQQYFEKKGVQSPPDFKMREMAAKYETHCKYLNKKKKSGEI